MTIDFDKILAWLNSLSEMQAVPLTFIGCLALGRGLKWVWFVKNQYIPTIVIFVGPLLLIGLTDYRESPAQSVKAFWFRTGIIGAITSTTAWAVHRYALKPIWAKFFGKDDNGDSNPPIAIRGIAPVPLGEKPELPEARP